MRRSARAASTRSSSTAPRYDERRADPSGTPLLKPRPVHDWTSHAADAFRYLALALDRQATQTGFYRRIDYATEGVV